MPTNSRTATVPGAPTCRGGDGETEDLLAWRLGVDACSGELAARLRQELSRLNILHEPEWPQAVENPSAAIGIAMRNLIPAERPGIGLLDIGMSAVLLHAAAGQPAALMILDYVRDWAARRDARARS